MARAKNVRVLATAIAAVLAVCTLVLILAAQPSQAASSTVSDIADPDAYSCPDPTLAFLDFEDLPDGTNLSSGAFNGVQFTTTGGFTWLVGDFATGRYAGKYPLLDDPDGAYTSKGTHWAWLGRHQGTGRIDFVNGKASEFSLLVSANDSPVSLEAYDENDNLLATAGPTSSNFNTGHMDELRITRDTADIAYVIVHDTGNLFLIDAICTDAPGVSSNKPPKADAGGPYDVDETSSVQLSGSGTDDDGTVASYAWDLDNDGSFETPGQDLDNDGSSDDATFDAANLDGPSSHTVRLQVTDDNDAMGADTATVQVNNVAPTATKSFDSSADEGSSFILKLTDPSDPSSADTTAGFEYRFDCGNGSGYGAWGTTNSASCSTNDNGTRNVKAEIRDKDGGSTEYLGTVTVNNASPSVTAAGPQSSDEGENHAFNLGSFSDAGDNDGLWTVVVDWGDGSHDAFNAPSTGSLGSRNHIYADGLATRSVTVTVTDKDGGAAVSTFPVTVNNVAPVLSTLSLSGNTGTACVSGNTVSLSFSFSDVGTSDTHSGKIEWGDGSADTTFTSSPQNNVSHSYGAGTYTIKVTVNDDDGGQDSDTASVSKLYNMSAILAPFNADGNSTWKYGSTIPVKVQITNCNNQPVSGLAPKLGTSMVNAATPSATINEDVFSTSNADTGNVLRYSDGIYIYNFNSKSAAITDQNATYWMSVKGLNAAGQVVTSPAQVDQKFGIRSK